MEIKRYSPFKRLKVTVSNVEWDFDGMDEAEEEAARKSLPAGGVIEWTPRELFDQEVLEIDEDVPTDWLLDEDKLEELVSEKITDDSEFCHNGFSMRYSVFP
jgi:hypothetical protein